MTENKWTPGPWEWDGGCRASLRGPTGKHVVSVKCGAINAQLEETTTADERLLRSAPEMHAACVAALAILRQVSEIIGAGKQAEISGSGGASYLSGEEVHPAINALRAALARARGET